LAVEHERNEPRSASIRRRSDTPGGFKTGIWDEFEADIARHTGSIYRTGYRRIRALVEPFTMFMGQPDGVARTIAKALTAGSPRARYIVGRDAQAIAVTRSLQPLVPSGLRDRITRVVAGL
jgi:hypothetical protein